MIFAALGAVRGNLRALEAVFHALDAEGIQLALCTGDLFAGGPAPSKILHALDHRGVYWVQGTRDHRVASFHRKHDSLLRKTSKTEFEDLARASDALPPTALETIRATPHLRSLRFEGLSIVLMHGTDSSASRTLHADDPDAKFQRQREALRADIVVVGPSEAPFVRWMDKTLFVAPGPLVSTDDVDGPACYSLINTEDEPWTVQHLDAPVESER